MATNTHHDDRKVPELAELKLPDKPDGPAAAAMISAGIGILILGLMTVLNEISDGINSFLVAFDFVDGVGPLAGKTMVAVIGFAVAWIVLGYMWKDRDVDIKKMFWIGLALGALGALFTFPPFFLIFHG